MKVYAVVYRYSNDFILRTHAIFSTIDLAKEFIKSRASTGIADAYINEFELDDFTTNEPIKTYYDT